ncbi:hypothetical protein ASC94_25825 [Massilia sp. Root418]|jgi:uncharacterized protein YbjT (DUF2867 family)|uniref:SDR family oxidoreductase n=1 Tax=Massilia sp. Root418 TaxID=1736532 RepID=UPI000700B171|nr:SDR family oxidoreductase [Massilia sp. Root418]KQW87914.1 hypothetical protein ASC94_25825 [Massilia sp. Root418]
MRILVLGATGLIGRHLLAALRAAGHEAIGASRRAPKWAAAPGTDGGPAWRELDFGALTGADAWLPHLDGIDAVVNCVGILRERSPGDYERLHHQAPAALFAACARTGIRPGIRVIHFSALGSTGDAPTAYWRSKAAGEQALARHPALDATIVRPSLVYGADGASSKLFLALATLPAVALPAAHSSRVQPVHIDDLCAAVLALLERPASAPPVPELAAVGPCAMSLAAYLACLGGGLAAAATAPNAQRMQRVPSMSSVPRVPCVPSSPSTPCMPCVLDVPMPLALLAARVAALHPASAVTPDTLTMLAASANGGNTAGPEAMRALLDGRPLREPAGFATSGQKPVAVLAWAMPLAAMVMAALWLWTAYVSWFAWPHTDSIAWLTACGIPAAWGEATLAAASLLDAAIGCALLLRRRRWLWPLQAALVGGYTVAMSFCLPGFWLHPFGPLSKNLPILVLLLAMWRLEQRQ